MALWIVMLIIAGVSLIVGLICLICHKNYIGDPYTGVVGMILCATFGVIGISSIFSYNEGTIVYIDDRGQIEYAETEEYNGEKYYPEPTKRSIYVIDDNTITVDGKTYLTEEKFYSELHLGRAEETSGHTVTFVDERTIDIDGKTYIISE